MVELLRRLGRGARSRALRTRHRLARVEVDILHAVFGDRPLPLHAWLAREAAVSLFGHLPNAGKPTSREGGALLAPEYDALLTGLPVGGWALEATTLSYLVEQCFRHQPRTVLELGSGTSTVLLAKVLGEVSRGTKPTLLSIEQSADGVARVEAALAGRGLDIAQVVHVPLDAHDQYERTAFVEALARFDRPIDMVVIDGPSGRPGCRAASLENALDFCSDQCRWFLDDALRPGELGILRRWRAHPRIVVDGIVPVGQGLATGRVVRT